MKNSVATGDRVTLRLKGNDVLVHNIIAIASGEYSGVVYGFEPNHLVEVDGIKIGDKINFNDCQIISCSSAY